LASIAALPSVPEAVQASRAAIDGLLGQRLLRRRSSEVSAESALRGAVAAARLQTGELTRWPLEDVRYALRSGRLLDGSEGSGAALRGGVRMYADIGPVLATWRRAPRQALARLHALAAADMVGSEALGRPRRPAEVVADLAALGPAPAAHGVAGRLDDLAALVTSPTTAPAAVVAAVVHGELLAVRPFSDGNVLVALAAQRLVLVSRGLDPKAVGVPEVGHVELGAQAYADAARGYLTGGPDGVAAWVAYCARAVELGAREGVAVCEAVERGS
jgi:hypothetical protein